MVRRKPGQLWVKECNEKECDKNGKRFHYHRFNPNGGAMKPLEMTIRRAINIIDVFDALPPKSDWTDAEPKDLRKALGTDTFDPTQSLWPELWARYKDKSLHQQVLDLMENLPTDDMSDNTRKELTDGINRIRKA